MKKLAILQLILLLLLFLVSVLVTSCERRGMTTFRAEMYVHIVNESGVYCRKMPVMWDFDVDNKTKVCFMIDKEYCFDILRESKTNSGAIMVNEYGEKCSIHLIKTKIGIIIFISNIDNAYPNFVMSTSNICAPYTE